MFLEIQVNQIPPQMFGLLELFWRRPGAFVWASVCAACLLTLQSSLNVLLLGHKVRSCEIPAVQSQIEKMKENILYKVQQKIISFVSTFNNACNYCTIIAQNNYQSITLLHSTKKQLTIFLTCTTWQIAIKWTTQLIMAAHKDVIMVAHMQLVTTQWCRQLHTYDWYELLGHQLEFCQRIVIIFLTMLG